MTQVFLNYRSDDEPYGVSLLDRELSERFGSAAVFLDSKSIPLGSYWEPELIRALARSDALLAIIGRAWLDARANGRRRIDDPDDFVRREILTATNLRIPVIPVRLGVPRLSKADLPPELAPLVDCQDIEIRIRDNGIDIDHLAARLVERIPALSPPQQPEPPPRPADATGNRVVIKNVRNRDGYIAGGDINIGPRHRRP